MKFGPLPLVEAEGALLAHSLHLGAQSFKKGRLLSKADLAQLAAAGLTQVVVAKLEADDVGENEAADALAAAVMGPGLIASAAFTGRVNLFATQRGLLVVEAAALDALNEVDEALTLASLPPFDLLEPKQMAATVKVIPFAVSAATLQRALVSRPLLSIAPFKPRRVLLLQTELPGMKASLLDKTLAALNQRLAALDCPPATEQRLPHDAAHLAEALEQSVVAQDILLVSGASAIVDRQDVIPAAIERAGGQVEHFGMPVDPGNLLLLGRLQGKPVLGLPGCARSPKLNGFDWVLQRLVAGLTVTPRDVMRMGVGGLLKEIAERLLPRAAAEPPRALPSRAPKIAALVLAAGRSTRMGGPNKLLQDLGGKALLRHAVEAAVGSHVISTHVVVGHQGAEVAKTLADLPIALVPNPDYAAGLASSLRRGLAALAADLDGVLVLLGDMPRVSSALLNRLIAAFNPLEGRSLIVPTFEGKGGNPLLIARRFFAEMQTIQGDQGARQLLSAYPEEIAEIAADSAVLLDVDTPEALAMVKARS